MRWIDVMTKKAHVLAVLEDGSFKDTRQVKVLLKEFFNLESGLDAVRKHLERCFDQRLVTREKIGRSYHYKITGNGKERLRRIRAKRNKEAEEGRDKFAERSESESPLSARRKLVEIRPFDRALLEVATSIRLCDIVLSLSDDPEILNWARLVKASWLLEYQKLIPHLPIQTVIAVYSIISNNVILAKQQETNSWIDLLVERKRGEEGEYASYCLKQEREEKERYKKSYIEEKSKRKELEKEFTRTKLEKQLSPIRGDWQQDYSEAFNLGRKIGKLETVTEQIIPQQKLIISLLQHRWSEKQKNDEAAHAILLRRRINWRWWDLLPPGSNSPLPTT